MFMCWISIWCWSIRRGSISTLSHSSLSTFSAVSECIKDSGEEFCHLTSHERGNIPGEKSWDMIMVKKRFKAAEKVWKFVRENGIRALIDFLILRCHRAHVQILAEVRLFVTWNSKSSTWFSIYCLCFLPANCKLHQPEFSGSIKIKLSTFYDFRMAWISLQISKWPSQVAHSDFEVGRVNSIGQVSCGASANCWCINWNLSRVALVFHLMISSIRRCRREYKLIHHKAGPSM